MGEKFEFAPKPEQEKNISGQKPETPEKEKKNPQQIILSYKQKMETGFNDFLTIERETKGKDFEKDEELLRHDLFNPIVEGFSFVAQATATDRVINITGPDRKFRVYDLDEVADIRKMMSDLEKDIYQISPKRLFQALYAKVRSVIKGKFSLKEGNDKWDLIKKWLHEEVFKNMCQELIDSAIQRKQDKSELAQTNKQPETPSPESIADQAVPAEKLPSQQIIEEPAQNIQPQLQAEEPLPAPQETPISEPEILPTKPNASESLLNDIRERRINTAGVPKQMQDAIVGLIEGLKEDNNEDAKKSLESLIENMKRDQLDSLDLIQTTAEQVRQLNSHISALEEKLENQATRIETITTIKNDYEDEILQNYETIEALQEQIVKFRERLTRSETQVQQAEQTKQEQEALQESKKQQAIEYATTMEERIVELDDQQHSIVEWLREAGTLETVTEKAKLAIQKQKALSIPEKRKLLDASEQKIYGMIEIIKQECGIPEHTTEAQTRLSALNKLISRLDREKQAFSLLSQDPLLWQKELPAYPPLEKLEQSEILLVILPNHNELLREAAQRTGKQSLFPDLFDAMPEQEKQLDQQAAQAPTNVPKVAINVPAIEQIPKQVQLFEEVVEVTPINEFIEGKEKELIEIAKIDLPYSIELSGNTEAKARAVEQFFQSLQGKSAQQIRDTLSLPSKSSGAGEETYNNFVRSIETGEFIDKLKESVVMLGALRRLDFEKSRTGSWFYSCNSKKLEEVMKIAGMTELEERKRISDFLLGTTLGMSHTSRDEVKLINKSFTTSSFGLTPDAEEISKFWTKELVKSKKISTDRLKKLCVAVNKK